MFLGNKTPFLFLNSFNNCFLLLVLIAIGCTRAHHKLYAGPQLPISEIAILKGESPVLLIEIDEQAGPNGRFLFGTCVAAGFCMKGYCNSRYVGGEYYIELLPGKHTLLVGYYKTRPSHGGKAYTSSTMPILIEFEAKAGLTYTIQVEYHDSSTKWIPKVVPVKFIDNLPEK